MNEASEIMHDETSKQSNNQEDIHLPIAVWPITTIEGMCSMYKSQVENIQANVGCTHSKLVTVASYRRFLCYISGQQVKLCHPLTITTSSQGTINARMAYITPGSRLPW